MMRYRLIPLLLVALLALTACNLSSEPDDVEPIVTATGAASGKPAVTISSPANGDEVVANEELLISASATDAVGVQRVQLLADGQIVKTVSSESGRGDTTLNVLLDYTPRREGNMRLQVIAYRGAIASDPAELNLVVRRGEAQVTATAVPAANVPQINPNDPTCRVLTNVGLNLRSGPGTNYGVITVLQAGAVAPIVGRLGSNEWWQLRVNTTVGWVSAAFTTVYGNCGAVPIVNPPATPTSAVLPTSTPAPTFTPIPPATAAPQPTSAPGPADLVISQFSGPEELVLGAGESEVIGSYAVTITNTGGSATGQFSNVIVKIPGSVEIPLGTVGGLDRNQSVVLTVDITFDAPGEYTLSARSDNGANISEQSEVNNNALHGVTVTGG